MLKNSILGLFLVFLSGCSLFTPQKLKLNLPPGPELKLKPIEFLVISKDSADLIFKQLNKESDYVIIGLTDQGYINLSINMKDIQNYIIYQNKVIKIYKDYYEKD